MANSVADPFVPLTTKLSVEISQSSPLVFSRLRQFNEVVFWEWSEIRDVVRSDSDAFLTLAVHDRIDNLAVSSYQDPQLWWFLSLANDIRLPPLQMQPGYRFRVPPLDIVREYLLGR